MEWIINVTKVTKVFVGPDFYYKKVHAFRVICDTPFQAHEVYSLLRSSLGEQYHLEVTEWNKTGVDVTSDFES